MPRNLENERRRRDARQAAQGITNDDLVEEFRHLVLPAQDYILPQSLRQHDAVAHEFANILSENVVMMRGLRMQSYDDFRLNNFHFPERKIIVTVTRTHAMAYAARRDAIGKPKLKSHMEQFWKRFCSVWRRRTGFVVSKEDRKIGEEEALNAAARYKFTEGKPKPILTPDTIRAIQNSVWFKAFKAPIRKRLNIIMFLACVVGTAARPGTFVRPSLGIIRESDLARPDTGREWLQARAEIRRNIKGAQYGQFIIHVTPPPRGSTVNTLIAFYKPSWSKTRLGKGRVFVLLPGPTLADSPCVLLLVLLVLKGDITIDTFKTIFDAGFLGGKQSRRLRLPMGCLSSPAMVTRRGTPVSTSQMTKDLNQLSIMCGFKHLFTSYSGRHLGSQSLRKRGASVSDVRAALDHQHGSAATACYEARVVPFSGSAVFGGKLTRNQHAGLATEMRPHALAPVTLTETEKMDLEEEAQREMDDPQRTGKADYEYRLKRATKRKLDTLRADFFSGASAAKQPRPASTLAGGGQQMGPIEEKWYAALSKSPKEPLHALVECMKQYLLPTPKAKGRAGGKSKQQAEEGEEEEDDSDVQSEDDIDVTLLEKDGGVNDAWSADGDATDVSDIVDSCDSDSDQTDLDERSETDYQL